MFIKLYFIALSFIFFTQQTSICVLPMYQVQLDVGKIKVNRAGPLPSRNSGSEGWERQTCIGGYESNVPREVHFVQGQATIVTVKGDAYHSFGHVCAHTSVKGKESSAGRGVEVRESSPSMLFAVAKVKPGRSKKTISGSCYISIPAWDRNQEVIIRKEPECYTKVILSYERGYISSAIPTFNRGCSLIQTDKCFMEEFEISAIGTLLSSSTPPKTHQVNLDLPLVLPTEHGCYIHGSKSKNRIKR